MRTDIKHRFGLEFDHLGLATRNPEKTVAFLHGLGYRSQKPMYDPFQKVNLTLCQSESMPTVEVIAPSSEAGPLDQILATRSEMLYHLCYRSRELASSLEAIRQAGHRVMQVVAPQPAILFGNRNVSFYMIKDFGLIEIIEAGEAE